jgi:hypothetical protein
MARRSLLAILLLTSFACPPLWADGPVEKQALVREIFVPEADLDALLEGQPERMLLSRSEYEELLKKAEETPEKHAPHKALVVAADYTATVEPGRARVVGKLTFEVLEDGLWALPLRLSGVGLRHANLDGSSAPLARSSKDQLTLFLEGTGRHELVIEMVAPMATTAARQRLTLHLPEAPSSRLRLTVPGDVEIKSGAHVAERVVDEQAGVTRFELPTATGAIDLNLSLNSRLLRRDRVVVARSVLVDEITEAYERLHATVSLSVLHRAVERFDFELPHGFEITDVATPQLARWAVSSQDDRRVLEVHLREPATDSVLLTLSALRTGTDLSNWQLPRFIPLDVMAESAVVGLLVDQRLTAETVTSQGMIPIDTSVLRRAIPETVFHAAPGAPPVRPVAAWYAPQGEFDVAASFVKLPGEVAVTTNLLLIIEDQRQRVQGGFLLMPEGDPLFEVEIDVPPGWHVTSVTGAEEQPLSHERYGGESDEQRVRVRLPRGVEPGQEYRIYLEAESMPSGWFREWETEAVEFPKFAVRGAGRDVGAIAVDARDDMIAQPDPDKTQRLSLLAKDDKAKHLAGVVTDLAYRYETPDYRLPLVVTRTTPRLTASTFSFLRIEPDAFVAHYELIYDVEEARTRRLSLSLPEDTPEAVAIAGLDGVRLKEYVASVVDGKRRWDVLLAEPRSGRIRLAVDFQQPLTVEAQEGLPLPIVRADGVTWQSGHVAVEGDAELEVTVQADPRVRRVDVGELVDADYQPGRRLLGVFGYVDQPGAVTVDVIRREGHHLFAAIVHQTRLVSRVSAAGVCQTVAEFRLLTKIPLVEVSLPEKAELWSGNVDGKPIRPQKEADRWLINLPATTEGQTLTLQLVYEMPVALTSFRGQIDMKAPELRFRGSDGIAGQVVPTADLQWDLHPPSGCTVLDASGTVMWEPDRPTPAIWNLAKGFGGVLFGSPLLAFSRLEARLVNQDRVLPDAWYMNDDVQYFGEATAMPSDAAEAAVQLGEMVESEEMDMERPAEEAKREAAPAEAPAPPPAAQPFDRPDVSRKPAGPSATRARLVPQRRGFQSANALRIELHSGPADQEPVVTFTSLGTSPRLVVTLADSPGMSTLSWAIALLVVLGGLGLTVTKTRQKLLYVLTVIGAGSLIPVLDSVFPFLPNMSATLLPANAAVYAAGLLLPYYLIAGFVRWLLHTGKSLLFRAPAVAAAMFVIGLAGMQHPALGEEPPTRPYVVEIVDSMPPVSIPDDAVVIPYDAEEENGVSKADRILVPYAKYVEFWDRAYPDAKKTRVPPPATYALAGVTYQTTLVDDGDLLLDGQMEIDVFVDERTEVALGLDGGVFARAVLDGKPARLSVPEIRPAPPNAAPAQQAQQQAPAIESKPIVLVHVEGKGRHRLEFTLRTRLQRQGGWRTVRTRVPTAPAAAIEIRVPQAETEVLLQEIADRQTHKTETAGEEIRTTLGPDGILRLQWRPSVAEGVVDHSLTAESNAVLDVQEDGLRLAWKLQLEFRRSEHERFSVHVPKDYLVERIDGTNVRGWQVEHREADTVVTITLLKAVEGREEFTLHLWRGQAMGGVEPTRFTSPTVRVDGASLHKGRITIRRSPMLDLSVDDAVGASRTDVPDDASGKELALEESPWGIRTFQAYRFGKSDFVIRLAAEPIEAKISAVLQSALRITEYERTLECRAQYSAANRPMYQAEILLPESFDLQDVSAPGEFEWSLTDQDGRPKLTVLLASGQKGNVPIVFDGRLPQEETGQDVAIPNVHALGVSFRTGQMAVQVDPAFDVAARDLAGCRTLLLNQVAHWLSKEQQQVTAVALMQTRADYSGNLRLSYRQPDVHCDTITNVRVTDRALEETILLDYRVQHAGVRELSFTLPSWMADARIRVPMLRQKTIEPDGDDEESPIHVRLELQDEVMGEVRVLIENDRMLQTGVDLLAPIPQVLKGERFDAFSVRQFVTLEKAGLDDIQLDDDASVGVERLNRRQLQWAQLATILGEGITEAFLVDETHETPLLAFRARRFEARRTTDARIGMAETRFVLDESGAFRAEQLYWIDNKTEQYLEIDMPAGAELWTAQLWTLTAWTAHQKGEPTVGEPIKPTRAPESAGPGRIRIPLVKTAEGDSDYVVRLQYAGTIGETGIFSRFDLPFIRPVGIKVDQSQVRLYVPETHWFKFDDTMTRVRDVWDLRAGRSAYETSNLMKFKDVLREGNVYAKARALNSVTVLHDSQVQFDDYGSNERFQEESRRNAAVFKEVQEESSEVEKSLQQTVTFDNRDRLRQQVDVQTNRFAKNVVQGLESNFKADIANARGAKLPTRPDAGNFNTLWLDESRLSNEPAVVADGKPGKKAMPSKPKGQQRVATGSQGRASRGKADASQPGPGISQKKLPGLTVGKDADEALGRIAGRQTIADGEKQRQAVARYQSRHMQQQQVPSRPEYATPQAGERGEPTRRGSGSAAGMGGGMGGGAYGYGNQPAQPMPTSEAVPATDFLTATAQQSARGLGAPLPAGLASLDVDIPFRGQEYLFTTPQGDVRITGYAVAADTTRGVGQAIAILLSVAAAAYVLLLGVRGRFDWWLGRTGSTSMIAIGLLALLCLPVIGVLAIVGGVMIKVNRSSTGSWPKASSPAASSGASTTVSN